MNGEHKVITIDMQQIERDLLLDLLKISKDDMTIVREDLKRELKRLDYEDTRIALQICRKDLDILEGFIKRLEEAE